MRAMLTRWVRPAAAIAVASAALGVVPAAGDGPGPAEVVVYSTLEREFSGPVFDAYPPKIGVVVRPEFDPKGRKTVGLTDRIIAESGSPRCDLFWNSEVLCTVRLRQKGLLAPFRPPGAGRIPDRYQARDGTWYGFAARARVLLVNTELVREADRPRSVRDLADPRWKGKAGLSLPLVGTGATHAACLFAAWGDDEAKAFYRAVKANEARVYPGNGGVAEAVGAGKIAFGLTDTDDAVKEVAAGRPVAIVYPNRDPGGLGTLFVPNTIALIAGSPHAREAAALADRLLSADVEADLVNGPAAMIPLIRGDQARARVETPDTVPPMRVDYEEAARAWDRAAAFLAREFAR